MMTLQQMEQSILALSKGCCCSTAPLTVGVPRTISLTTTGSTGPATYNAATRVLNIPSYSTSTAGGNIIDTLQNTLLAGNNSTISINIEGSAISSYTAGLANVAALHPEGHLLLKTAGANATLRATNVTGLDKIIQLPNVSGTLVASVNNILPDINGNVTIAAGGSTRFGIEDNLGIQDRLVNMQGKLLTLNSGLSPSLNAVLTHYGTGVNDITFSGTPTVPNYFYVYIASTAGAVDLFSWNTVTDSNNGIPDFENIPITAGVPYLLKDGISITFATATGHGNKGWNYEITNSLPNTELFKIKNATTNVFTTRSSGEVYINEYSGNKFKVNTLSDPLSVDGTGKIIKTAISLFGISDNLGIQDRAMDMDGRSLTIYNGNAIYLSADDNITTSSMTVSPTSSQLAYTTTSKVSYFDLNGLGDNILYQQQLANGAISLRQKFVKLEQRTGEYFVPLSVNGSVADATGNITITTGGSTRFGFAGEDTTASVSRSFALTGGAAFTYSGGQYSWIPDGGGIMTYNNLGHNLYIQNATASQYSYFQPGQVSVTNSAGNTNNLVGIGMVLTNATSTTVVSRNVAAFGTTPEVKFPDTSGNLANSVTVNGTTYAANAAGNVNLGTIGGGGGAATRFGFLGEDVTATGNRNFDLANNNLNLNNGRLNFVQAGVDAPWSIQLDGSGTTGLIKLRNSTSILHPGLHLQPGLIIITGNEFNNQLRFQNGTTGTKNINIQPPSDAAWTAGDKNLTLPMNNGVIPLSVNGTPADAAGNIPLVKIADNYADDAAAAIGGIAVSGLYHTGGVVKIRLS